jgi:PKHD-type hydroxylase
MLLQIPSVLREEELAECLVELGRASWADGRATAGHLSHDVKRNHQLHFQDPIAIRLGELILSRLRQTAIFLSAALPHRILPPLFNRYAQGESYGSHLDGAIRPVDGTQAHIRTDLSATLMISAPADYDGGELVIEDDTSEHSFKLEGGDLLLYPTTSIHRVEPITRGVRFASFFWIQSIVRDNGERALLFQLDASIQRLRATPEHDRRSVLEFSNIYHNLLRRWADI